MVRPGAASFGSKEFPVRRSRRRDLVEVAVAYGLILLVVWSPRPWQRLLWWVAAAGIAAILCISFDGLKAMGLQRANFFRSLWVPCTALLAAAVAVELAVWFHTLRLPGSPLAFVERYWAYALWAGAQQFLLQCFFLLRLLRVFGSPKRAALAAAGLFTAAHLPNPLLASITLLWGVASCLLFLRYRNLYPLAMAHAILGVTIAITIPGPVDHNMRVGLGYLSYRHGDRPHRLAQP
jgi:hypothetical protein